MGGNVTKIKIKGYLKNIIDNKVDEFNGNAIKSKNKLSYIVNEEKYTLKILSSTKLILIRENKEIINTIYFEKEKCLSSTYFIKDQDLTLDIDITTLSLYVSDEIIKIVYLVNDSNNKYEYYLSQE